MQNHHNYLTPIYGSGVRACSEMSDDEDAVLYHFLICLHPTRLTLGSGWARGGGCGPLPPHLPGPHSASRAEIGEVAGIRDGALGGLCFSEHRCLLYAWEAVMGGRELVSGSPLDSDLGVSPNPQCERTKKGSGHTNGVSPRQEKLLSVCP